MHPKKRIVQLSILAIGAILFSLLSSEAQAATTPTCSTNMNLTKAGQNKGAGNAEIFIAFRGTLTGGPARFTDTCAAEFPIAKMPPPYNKWHYVAMFRPERSHEVPTKPHTGYFVGCGDLRITSLTETSVKVAAEFRNEWTGRPATCQYSGWMGIAR